MRANEARELLRTRADLRHGVSQFYQGVCIGMLEGEAAAVDAYEAAIAAMPTMTVAYVNLIRALLARARPGDHDRALHLGRTSAASQPCAAEPQYTLGVIHMQMGRTREAAQAFEKALQMDPTHHGALVNGAHTLTALFSEEPDATAESLRRRIMSLGCLGVAAGLWEDSRQRPPCFVRNLRPSKPWHDPAAFEMVAVLEAAYPDIKAELLAARRAQAGNGGPAFTPVGGRATHDHTIVAKGQWQELPLFGNGSRHELHCAMCPRTAAAVGLCPLATDLALVGGGETLFSVVRGRTHLRPHCGSTNARLTCHLGIVIPDGCEVRVGDETRTCATRNRPLRKTSTPRTVHYAIARNIVDFLFARAGGHCQLTFTHALSPHILFSCQPTYRTQSMHWPYPGHNFAPSPYAQVDRGQVHRIR
jgi:aspartate beta-hydroxylase